MSLFLHVRVRCVHHRVHYFPFAQELFKVIDEASMLNRQLDTVRAENIQISKVRTITGFKLTSNSHCYLLCMIACLQNFTAENSVLSKKQNKLTQLCKVS